jgi:ribose transport system ATP-binding protein
MQTAHSQKSTKLLEMHQISKTFPGVLALNKVEFDLKKGEVHILVGENGAGKSTLMKILSGAYRQDSGQIMLDGQFIKIHHPKIAQDLGISTIYQEFNLVPHLSVAANIFLGREPSLAMGFINRHKLHDRTRQILEELGLKIDPFIQVRRLNVAQQQMVEVAKALVIQAKILIMDEPTSALTSSEIDTLFETINLIKKRGVGIIYISHRLEELFRIGDRVTVLRDGNLIGTYSISEVDKDELVRLMANRELKEYFPRINIQVGEKVLEVSHLSIQSKLNDISFYLKRGEILGIAGLLGAGRTELARAIFGVDSIDSGLIKIAGESKKIKSPAIAIKLGIGFLTEDRKNLGLILPLSLKDNISLPNLNNLSKYGILRATSEKELARKYTDELNIKTPTIYQKLVNLSGGNQQKVVLSKWLAHHTDILIFDEPTRGIDVASKVEIYHLMNRLKAQGVGIIMISSELPEILGISDRILVMCDGRIVAEYASGEATQELILSKALGEVA